MKAGLGVLRGCPDECATRNLQKRVQTPTQLRGARRGRKRLEESPRCLVGSMRKGVGGARWDGLPHVDKELNKERSKLGWLLSLQHFLIVDLGS
eukprot:760245-Hanusia_phi.AAC.1